jgi:hypothetical protein
MVYTRALIFNTQLTLIYRAIRNRALIVLKYVFTKRKLKKLKQVSKTGKFHQLLMIGK